MSNIFDQNLDLFFSDARARLGDDYLSALNSAGISEKTSSFSKLPISKLNVLCNELFVTLDSIASRNVDFSIIKDHLKGGSKIPTKYLQNVPYSSRFTTIYMLNYLRSVLGNDQVKVICQHFQLKEAQLVSLSERNNLLLPHDLCAYVSKFFGEGYVREMGASSVELFKKSEAFQALAMERSVNNFFERFIFEVLPEHVERNFKWRIDRSGPGYIQISGQPLGDVVESLKFHKEGVLALEILREGFIHALMNFTGVPVASVERTKSMSSGDSCDTYFVRYGQRESEFQIVH